MEISILQIAGAAVVAVGVGLLGWEIARHATEERPLPWNFKPFNCRACLTFWLVLLLEGLAFHVVTPVPWWPAVVCALISAFSAFFIFKNKYKVYN